MTLVLVLPLASGSFRDTTYTQPRTHVIDVCTCNATLTMDERRNAERRNSDARALLRRHGGEKGKEREMYGGGSRGRRALVFSIWGQRSRYRDFADLKQL